MYVQCLIEYKDDKEQQEVIIKTDNTFIEEEDDRIFFYGLSINDIAKSIRESSLCENEWKILEVIDIFTSIK